MFGRTVSLEPAALVAKLCAPAPTRGGYCFEVNTLLGAALAALGFRVAPRAARVWVRAERYDPRAPQQPRLHMLLIVRAAGDACDWLVDVGFGGGGPAVPLPLAAGAVTRANGEAFRLSRGDAAAGEDDWILHALGGGEWRRLYAFEHSGDDAPPASWFVCTAPGLFTSTRFATRTNGAGRASIVQNELRLRDGAEAEGQPAPLRVLPLRDSAAYAAAAREHLGIELSAAEAETIFQANAAACCSS
jgi:N-hydroxyarylamine O-acetyltransferase